MTVDSPFALSLAFRSETLMADTLIAIDLQIKHPDFYDPDFYDPDFYDPDFCDRQAAASQRVHILTKMHLSQSISSSF